MPVAFTLAALSGAAGLSGCADQNTAATASVPPARIPPQQFAPGTVTETAPPENVTLVNDPSAPASTPLCGTAAREANAMAAAMYPQPLSSGNACTQNACFDPATQTYIASDNTRRVCR
ncbi:hypothetical protein [Acetobacter fallax]|uniref:Lectin-like protein BA14k n=1 Tax=Acetobacter fallax TaxID=1737473 RepID=A0ABX0KBN9_9PROT|nr:hypothetical protein [Acetobacter fallax]NHO37422.1 hypothetical protein [Acetobacter fallax]